MKTYVLEDSTIVQATRPMRKWASKITCELPSELILNKFPLEHKAFKIIEETDELGDTVKRAVLDEVAEAQRLADEAQKLTDKKVQEMRAKRDQLLKETDHIMLPDSPYSESKKAEYATYRQALRDLPSVISDINNFDYPVKPE